MTKKVLIGGHLEFLNVAAYKLIASPLPSSDLHSLSRKGTPKNPPQCGLEPATLRLLAERANRWAIEAVKIIRQVKT